ncbi:MAG TPA: EFR1 family ferrodoxin [Methanomicrobiales archaeon]|nr:EFR1 family ferrodoxin [Methanomicrobiales archaeon]
MKTVLYYFTGTGNSLATALVLRRRLGDCEILPISSLREAPGRVSPVADRVGIVTPVYFFGLPSFVAEFAGRLDLSRATYVFAIATMGGSGGSAALRQLDRILRDGHGGKGLDAGFMVRMPGNYVLMYGPPEGRSRDEILGEADRRMGEIGDLLDRGHRARLPWSPLASLVHRFIYPRFIAGVHDADRKFTVDNRCTSCGTCADVCPVENILLEAGRPVWLHRCEQCMACIHLCPTLAIQAGSGTEGRSRYRHPEVPVENLRRKPMP